MKKNSLKSKIVLYSSLVFFVLMPSVTSVALHYFQHQFSASIEDQLFTTVSLLAEDLDRKIISMQKVAAEVASGISAELLADPQRTLDHLKQHLGLSRLFDNGLAVFTTEGKIVAETRNQPSRTGFDLSYREYVQKTLQTRAPIISKPLISSQAHGHPVVVLTVPLLDSEGELFGIFVGSLDLLGENVLGGIATSKVGESGYFYLYTDDRTIVMHPDRSRIMQQDVSVGANKLFDLALEGFEGAGETVNSRGLHTLAAFKHLQSTNWILAANYPAAEAYAPVRTAERTAWLLVISGGLIVAAIMWLAMRQLIEPLLFLTAEMRQISASNRQPKKVQVRTGDEIGELAESFNRMMTELEKRESELAQSQELFQTLSDWSTDWIFWKSASGEMRYISPAGTKITGYSAEELLELGEHFEQLVHPDDRDLWQDHQNQADQGKEPPSLDFRIITKDGSVRWLSHFCQPIHAEDGQYLGLRGSNSDITERKRIEEQLRYLSVRDSLTGIYNRGCFDAELARLIKGRHFPVSLLIADLDRLKSVNDQFGHAAGDQLIRQAADLIRKAFRADDLVARIGGDEFAVLMVGADEEEAREAVLRIRDFEAEHNLSANGMEVFLSIGMATASDSKSLESAMVTADAKMYQDKQQRKNKS